MRTVRIRTFALLGLIFLSLLPWVFFVTAHLIENKTLRFTNQPHDLVQQQNLAETIHMIETNSDKWNDPSFKKQLISQLKQANMEADIRTASGQEIFRSNPERNRPLKSAEQFSILQDGQVMGRVVITFPNSNIVQIIATCAGLLLAFFIVGYEIRRFILKPLDKLSLVARQIAKGDLEVQLPESRIAEIAEVREGFEVMVTGLQDSYRKQKELEKERRFVIAAVAHDLRTPLFALRGYLDGLEQGIADSPDQMARYVAVCKEKSLQLGRLVEDLFTFTKMEYVETKLDEHKVDLKLLLQQSIESVSPRASQKNIMVSLNGTGDHCLIRGDSHLLERALNNLLDNAVRHTPPNGKIDVRCYKEGHSVKFVVHDTGPGFTSDELAHVFEPLYRGEESRNRSTGGAGLGLTISQKIIRRHGGELSAANGADGGAFLSGWIPIVTTDKTEA